MSKKEQWMFLYKTGMLLDAGLAVKEAFSIAQKGLRNKKLKDNVKNMIQDLSGGRSLKEIFFTYEQKWGKVTASLIAVGELSGTLSANIQRASENMRRTADQRTKLISSLFYPAIISILALGIILFLLAFVYPKIIPLFIGMRVELPFSTRFLIALSSAAQKYWAYGLVIILVNILFLFYINFKYKKVRLSFEKLILKIPFIGKIILLNQFCEAAFVTGSLCQGGIALSEALESEYIPAHFFTIKKYFEKVHADLSKGISFSDCVSMHSIFPAIWLDLIVVGERTGNLSSILIHISNLHRQEIDELMTTINKMIEPLMMIAVGLLVGFIALSIVGPMYSLTQHV